jgi:hypothetical protein
MNIPPSKRIPLRRKPLRRKPRAWPRWRWLHGNGLADGRCTKAGSVARALDLCNLSEDTAIGAQPARSRTVCVHTKGLANAAWACDYVATSYPRSIQPYNSCSNEDVAAHDPSTSSPSHPHAQRHRTCIASSSTPYSFFPPRRIPQYTRPREIATPTPPNCTKRDSPRTPPQHPTSIAIKAAGSHGYPTPLGSLPHST